MRLRLFAAAMLTALTLQPALAAPVTVAGASCGNPPPARCGGEACSSAPGGTLAEPGNATDPATGRRFFLDFPCDVKRGEKLIFILSLHGAGSIANWQRHYFPASDYANKYRLVVATPTAATLGTMGSGRGVRRWEAAADDQHLRNIADLVIKGFGARNIRSFWLAGHSQGGLTSSRIVCSPYFAGRVDGWLSLSGGRIGQAPFVAAFGPPRPDGSPPPPRPAGAMPQMAQPACDFSHIFAVGEHEISALPDSSPWATKYGCGPRAAPREIIDTAPGHVWDYARAGYPVWGMKARPGIAREFLYPGCRDGRVVADVVRIDKGHTEGLEPHVTEELIRLIASAPGGKVARAGA